jgi:DNA-directed RNA polymerase subunit beta'
MTLRDLEKVLYFESYVVTEPGTTPLKLHTVLTEDQFVDAQNEHGDGQFEAKIGAEAIRDMLAAIDLEKERDTMRAYL